MPERGYVAIVTGSTSGIGLGIAEALAGEGMDIVLNGFGDPGGIERLRSRLATTYGVRAAFRSLNWTPTKATTEPKI